MHRNFLNIEFTSIIVMSQNYIRMLWKWMLWMFIVCSTCGTCCASTCWADSDRLSRAFSLPPCDSRPTRQTAFSLRTTRCPVLRHIYIPPNRDTPANRWPAEPRHPPSSKSDSLFLRVLGFLLELSAIISWPKFLASDSPTLNFPHFQIILDFDLFHSLFLRSTLSSLIAGFFQGSCNIIKIREISWRHNFPIPKLFDFSIFAKIPSLHSFHIHVVKLSLLSEFWQVLRLAKFKNNQLFFKDFQKVLL